MSCAKDHAAASSPTLPDIELQSPLHIFDGPSGFGGDSSAEVEPERYVVADAVQDPASTDVPEAVPILGEVPTGSGIVQEITIVPEGERAKSKSSSSSSTSESTPRPTVVEKAKSRSSSSASQPITTTTVIESEAPAEPIVVRSGTTMLMNIVPKDASSDTRATTVMITVGDEEPSVPLHRVAVPQRSILKEAPKANADGSSQASSSSRRSLRSRIAKMWRSLVQKVMLKKAQKQKAV